MMMMKKQPNAKYVQAKLYVYPKYSKNLKIQDYNLDCYIVGDFRFYLM